MSKVYKHNVGHRNGALEAAAHAAINTLRLPPRLTNLHELVCMPALDLSLVLLHDLALGDALGGDEVEGLGSPHSRDW